MNFLIYQIARAFVTFLQTLPVTWVACMGRAGGALAYALDARHRRVAIRNLTACFGSEKSAAEIRAIARENFRRIGESFACAAKTSSMTKRQLEDHMQVVGIKKMLPKSPDEHPTSRVVAIGHFGNFELFAKAAHLLPWYQAATTYRDVGQPGLDRLLLELRKRSGCLFFERRRDGAALRAAVRKKHLIIGLLADQHSGNHGLRLPFLGRECSTSKAPAVFALRYGLPLQTAICFRTRLGHWRLEVGELIPTREHDQPRSLRDIMLDVNRAFEEAVRRDPANWFWVHNRWKPGHKMATPEPAIEDTEDGDEPPVPPIPDQAA